MVRFARALLKVKILMKKSSIHDFVLMFVDTSTFDNSNIGYFNQEKNECKFAKFAQKNYKSEN